MIRVFIADDHSIVRRGVRELLTHADGIDVVGEAADGHAVMNAYRPGAWDVLLLDLSLPKLSGSEVLRRLRAQDGQLLILVFSMYSEEQYGPRLRREGANGYLSKDDPSEQIVAAVRHVKAHGTYESSRLTAQLLATPGLAEKAPHQTLSGREFQILTLLCQSRTSIEIAAELDVSASTVANLLARIKQKLGARTTADIVTYAHRTGLTD